MITRVAKIVGSYKDLRGAANFYGPNQRSEYRGSSQQQISSNIYCMYEVLDFLKIASNVFYYTHLD